MISYVINCLGIIAFVLQKNWLFGLNSTFSQLVAYTRYWYQTDSVHACLHCHQTSCFNQMWEGLKSRQTLEWNKPWQGIVISNFTSGNQKMLFHSSPMERWHLDVVESMPESFNLCCASRPAKRTMWTMCGLSDCWDGELLLKCVEDMLQAVAICCDLVNWFEFMQSDTTNSPMDSCYLFGEVWQVVFLVTSGIKFQHLSAGAQRAWHRFGFLSWWHQWPSNCADVVQGAVHWNRSFASMTRFCRYGSTCRCHGWSLALTPTLTRKGLTARWPQCPCCSHCLLLGDNRCIPCEVMWGSWFCAFKFWYWLLHMQGLNF